LIYETSPLHDIGKLAIPDSVLLKPARVDAREFELLKTHTVQGAATLEAAFDRFPITQFFQMAREIVLSHHERFDGSGYPRHLAGTQIPLAGRIVALVDTYDALTSRRVYRDATSHTTARDVILAGAGTAFDPRLVRLFVELEEQFRAIREQAPSSLSVAPATPTVAPPVSSGPAWTTPVAAV
jgi:putative two-component system response regulator